MPGAVPGAVPVGTRLQSAETLSVVLAVTVPDEGVTVSHGSDALAVNVNGVAPRLKTSIRLELFAMASSGGRRATFESRDGNAISFPSTAIAIEASALGCTSTSGGAVSMSGC